jgi:hypothetical protein
MMSLHWRSAGYLFARTMELAVGRYSTCPEEPGRLQPGSFSCHYALDHPGDEGCVPRYSGTLVAIYVPEARVFGDVQHPLVCGTRPARPANGSRNTSGVS